MLTPAELLAANHPVGGAHGRLKREVILRAVYNISLRQWRRICTGEYEINQHLAHSLLDRYVTRYPQPPVVPCVFQELPGGDWLIRVRQEDVTRVVRLLNPVTVPEVD